MNSNERRRQIIERMKICTFDTASNMAHEFGVSRKTIFRDIQLLARCNYPIVAVMGKSGGIRWLNRKKRFHFTDEEVAMFRNTMHLLSYEDQLVLENMLCDSTPQEIKIQKSEISKLLVDGMSQTELARRLGVSNTLLSLVLSGKRNISKELSAKFLDYQKKYLSKNDDN